MNPIITANHLVNPTFSFNITGEKIVTINGAIKAKVRAFDNDIIDIEQKNKMFATNKRTPLNICNLGFIDKTKFFLKKKKLREV